MSICRGWSRAASGCIGLMKAALGLRFFPAFLAFFLGASFFFAAFLAVVFFLTGNALSPSRTNTERGIIQPRQPLSRARFSLKKQL